MYLVAGFCEVTAQQSPDPLVVFDHEESRHGRRVEENPQIVVADTITPMGRRVFFVGLWIVATVGIGLAARTAVSFVDRAVFPEGQAIRVIDLPPPTTTTTTTEPPVVALPATTTSTFAIPSTMTTTTSTTTTTVPPPPPTTLPETTTTVPETTTTTVVAVTTTTTVPAVQTVQAIGGSVTIRSSPNAVTLVSVKAAEGYSAETIDDGPTFVEVLFHHESGGGTSYVRCDAGPVTAICDAS